MTPHGFGIVGAIVTQVCTVDDSGPARLAPEVSIAEALNDGTGERCERPSDFAPGTLQRLKS